MHHNTFHVLKDTAHQIKSETYVGLIPGELSSTSNAVIAAWVSMGGADAEKQYPTPDRR